MIVLAFVFDYDPVTSYKWYFDVWCLHGMFSPNPTPSPRERAVEYDELPIGVHGICRVNGYQIWRYWSDYVGVCTSKYNVNVMASFKT